MNHSGETLTDVLKRMQVKMDADGQCQMRKVYYGRPTGDRCRNMVVHGYRVCQFHLNRRR